MIQLNAILICDRCSKHVAFVNDVEDQENAYGRFCGVQGWDLSEDGDDVCNDCWVKHESATKLDAVDPVDGRSTS